MPSLLHGFLIHKLFCKLRNYVGIEWCARFYVFRDKPTVPTFRTFQVENNDSWGENASHTPQEFCSALGFLPVTGILTVTFLAYFVIANLKCDSSFTYTIFETEKQQHLFSFWLRWPLSTWKHAQHQLLFLVTWA